MKYIIAVDWGGTKTIVALIKNNSIIKKIKYHTESNLAQIIKNLIEYIDIITTNVRKDDIKNIVIGCPSPVDKNGNLFYVESVKNIRKVSLKKIVEKRFNISTIVENDVKIQSLGEFSKYKKVNSLFYLILGTGVGASLIYKGQLYSGMNSAMEFGHSVIVANGEKCGCGNKGCLEAYCSGTGISERFYKKYHIRLNTKEILKLAKKRDRNALELLNETGYYLGIGLSNIVNIFEPDLIIINGGVTNLQRYFMKNALKTLNKNTLIKYRGKIIISKLQEDASLYGAIYITK